MGIWDWSGGVFVEILLSFTCSWNDSVSHSSCGVFPLKCWFCLNLVIRLFISWLYSLFILALLVCLGWKVHEVVVLYLFVFLIVGKVWGHNLNTVVLYLYLLVCAAWEDVIWRLIWYLVSFSEMDRFHRSSCLVLLVTIQTFSDHFTRHN